MERIALVIAGPTCSGKTALSIDLAKELNTEIISADSRQVYKHLTIGTAKPGEDELKQVKHHFIDTLNPNEYFNVSIYEKSALSVINDLSGENKIPVIAGGSGLYIKALVDGIFDCADTDPEVTLQVKEIINEKGYNYLYEELKKVDARSAESMLPSNWKRVTRAYEVFLSTGKPIWYWQENYKRETDIKFIQYGLLWDREILYKNIEKRVDEMISAGLVQEVENVLNLGYSKSLNSLNTVGYKEIIEYLEGKINLDRAAELIKRNTRRYAKRQMTWFNADKRINWIGIKEKEDLKKKLPEIMSKM